MNDIKNITDKILSDAQLWADEALKNANEQAEEILNSYTQKADKMKEETLLKAQQDAEDAVAHAQGAQKLRERNAVLAAKCEILDEAFSAAANSLSQLSADDYTQLLIKLFKAAHVTQSCIICMNQKDLDTVANGFLKEAKKLLSQENPALTLELSDKPVKISGGFILKNGDIELNCSLESFLSMCREKHENNIFKLLFN